MATPAFTSPPTPAFTAEEVAGIASRYTPALTPLTVLFCMMGVITCLNDILTPFPKAISA